MGGKSVNHESSVGQPFAFSIENHRFDSKTFSRLLGYVLVQILGLLLTFIHLIKLLPLLEVERRVKSDSLRKNFPPKSPSRLKMSPSEELQCSFSVFWEWERALSIWKIST